MLFGYGARPCRRARVRWGWVHCLHSIPVTNDGPDAPEDAPRTEGGDRAGTGTDGPSEGSSEQAADPSAERAAGTTAAADPEPKKRKQMPIWQESILLLAVALGLAILIKAVFVQAFYIPSESMEPGLIKNDRILVQKVSYWFGRDPQRGDVVVFEDPGSWLGPQDSQGPEGLANVLSKIGLYPTGGHLVKRVIGVEGDVISCCGDDGRIRVNGEPIDETEYLAKDPGSCAAERDALGARRACAWSVGPIPEGKLFVMGDNRGHSADSRAHMCAPKQDPCTESPWVDTDLVVGKVFALVWPRDRWDWISRPEAFDDVPDSPPAESDGATEGAATSTEGAATSTEGAARQ